MNENRRTAEQLLSRAQGTEPPVAAALAQVGIGYALLAAVDVLTEQLEVAKRAYGGGATAEAALHIADVDAASELAAHRYFGFDPTFGR